MILIRRIIPFVTPLFLGAALTGVFFRPEEWRIFFGLIAAIVVFTALVMVDWQWRTAPFFGILFPLVVYVAGAVGLLLFVERTGVQFTIATVLLIGVGMYLENVFTYRYQQQKYTKFSLPNLSVFMMTVAAFALFTGGFGLFLTNVITASQLTIAAAIFGVGLSRQLFWSYDIDTAHRGFITILIGALLAEVVWIVHYWPTAFFVNGLLIAIMVYAIPTLIQLRLRDALTKRLLKQYVLIALFAVLAVLASAQWKL